MTSWCVIMTAMTVPTVELTAVDQRQVVSCKLFRCVLRWTLRPGQTQAKSADEYDWRFCLYPVTAITSDTGNAHVYRISRKRTKFVCDEYPSEIKASFVDLLVGWASHCAKHLHTSLNRCVWRGILVMFDARSFCRLSLGSCLNNLHETRPNLSEVTRGSACR